MKDNDEVYKVVIAKGRPFEQPTHSGRRPTNVVTWTNGYRSTLKVVSIQNQIVSAKTSITWIDVSCVSLSDAIRILFRQRPRESSLVHAVGKRSVVRPYSIGGIVRPQPVVSSPSCYMTYTWILECPSYANTWQLSRLGIVPT